MSDEIFKWQPQMVEYGGSTKWNVTQSQFENTMKQRGLISERETNSFTFNFSNGLLTPGQTNKLKNEILAFYNARNGPYDNFYLPSWELEMVTSEDASSGTSTIKVVKDPSELNREAALSSGGNHNFEMPGALAAWTAMAAGWSSGAAATDENAPAPPEHLTTHAASGAIILAATVEPEKAKEMYRKFLETGVQIAQGKMQISA